HRHEPTYPCEFGQYNFDSFLRIEELQPPEEHHHRTTSDGQYSLLLPVPLRRKTYHSCPQRLDGTSTDRRLLWSGFRSSPGRDTASQRASDLLLARHPDDGTQTHQSG